MCSESLYLLLMVKKNRGKTFCGKVVPGWSDLIKCSTWPERSEKITELGYWKEAHLAETNKPYYLHSFNSLGSRVVKLSCLTDGQAPRSQHQNFGHLGKTTNKLYLERCTGVSVLNDMQTGLPTYVVCLPHLDSLRNSRFLWHHRCDAPLLPIPYQRDESIKQEL